MTITHDQLIATLSRNVPRVSRYALAKRVILGIAGGGLVTLILLTATLGIRPDIRFAMHGFSFWVKIAYTVSLGILAIYAVSQLARPTASAPRSMWLMAAPVLVLAGIGLGELAYAPTSEWWAMWLGRSWKECPLLVLTFSGPIFIGLLWSFRKLAPTRLRAAGATAGLCAGAWAATIYCLHCPEVSAIFVFTWYSLGILLAVGIGALIGPRILRW